MGFTYIKSAVVCYGDCENFGCSIREKTSLRVQRIFEFSPLLTAIDGRDETSLIPLFCRERGLPKRGHWKRKEMNVNIFSPVGTRKSFFSNLPGDCTEGGHTVLPSQKWKRNHELKNFLLHLGSTSTSLTSIHTRWWEHEQN